jgi:hypothetical protein
LKTWKSSCFWGFPIFWEVIMMHKRFTSLLVRIFPVIILFAFALLMVSVTAEAKIIDGMQVNSSQSAVLGMKNPQIQAVMAIQDHYSPALLALPEVVGTATGINEQGYPAVIVFTKGPGTSGIPASLGGVPVVIRVTGEFHSLKPSKGPGNSGGSGSQVSTTTVLTPPVPIGVSTGNENECSAGTIGARITDGTNDYALSNNHVYALENVAPIGSKVLQPGLYDTQCIDSGNNVIGELDYFVPIDFAGGSNTVDAALAGVYADAQNNPMVGNSTPPDGYGTPSKTTADPAIGVSVEKYGRTTQLTIGTMTAINATITVNYGASGNALFTGQVIIQSGKPFVKAGDSGSLIVTSSGLNPVALLFAGDNSGKYCVANDINVVLSKLSNLTHTTLRVDGK